MTCLPQSDIHFEEEPRRSSTSLASLLVSLEKMAAKQAARLPSASSTRSSGGGCGVAAALRKHAGESGTAHPADFEKLPIGRELSTLVATQSAVENSMMDRFCATTSGARCFLIKPTLLSATPLDQGELVAVNVHDTFLSSHHCLISFSPATSCVPRSETSFRGTPRMLKKRVRASRNEHASYPVVISA